MRRLVSKFVAFALMGLLLGAERPAITGVAHIALRTNDLAAAREFYGHVLGFRDTAGPQNSVRFIVNRQQLIEIYPNLASETDDRLINIAFLTTDVRQLRRYLASRGITVPGDVSEANGAVWFLVRDPEGHEIEFVQRAESAVPEPGDKNISNRMIHAGFTVQDRASEDHFYRDILAFHDIWHGGMQDERTDWVDMRVPNGTDWLEYMLNVHNPSPHTLGVMHHLALGVPDIQAGYHMVLDRGYKPPEPPKIGRDGKWQLNLYDPNGTRVELMEPKPVQTPCCSPMTSD